MTRAGSANATRPAWGLGDPRQIRPAGLMLGERGLDQPLPRTPAIMKIPVYGLPY